LSGDEYDDLDGQQIIGNRNKKFLNLTMEDGVVYKFLKYDERNCMDEPFYSDANTSAEFYSDTCHKSIYTCDDGKTKISTDNTNVHLNIDEIDKICDTLLGTTTELNVGLSKRVYCNVETKIFATSQMVASSIAGILAATVIGATVIPGLFTLAVASALSLANILACNEEVTKDVCCKWEYESNYMSYRSYLYCPEIW